MSNLNLPAMNYSNLMGIARAVKFTEQNKGYKKIAHNTYVRLDPINAERVQVKYHKTIIATIEPNAIRVNSGGWNTVTTAQRIDAVLRENTGNQFRCVRRNWLIQLIDKYDNDRMRPIDIDGEALVMNESGEYQSLSEYAYRYLA